MQGCLGEGRQQSYETTLIFIYLRGPVHPTLLCSTRPSKNFWAIGDSCSQQKNAGELRHLGSRHSIGWSEPIFSTRTPAQGFRWLPQMARTPGAPPHLQRGKTSPFSRRADPRIPIPDPTITVVHVISGRTLLAHIHAANRILRLKPISRLK